MVSSEDIARILKRPAGASPVQEEALRKEEVDDPSKLPFATVENEPHRIRFPTFNKILAGFFLQESKLFIEEHGATPDEWGRLVYMLVRLVVNGKPSPDDFSNETFLKALELLNAEEEWVATTREAVSILYSDFNEIQTSALIAMTRFFAITDDGYSKSIWAKPYWVTPSSDEIRKVRLT